LNWRGWGIGCGLSNVLTMSGIEQRAVVIWCSVCTVLYGIFDLLNRTAYCKFGRCWQGVEKCKLLILLLIIFKKKKKKREKMRFVRLYGHFRV